MNKTKRMMKNSHESILEYSKWQFLENLKMDNYISEKEREVVAKYLDLFCTSVNNLYDNFLETDIYPRMIND